MAEEERESQHKVTTDGGAHIEGDVSTQGGDFTGRDKIDASVFVAGDIAASMAIGKGAKIIHHQVNVQIAGSPAKERNQEALITKRRLTESILGIVARYELLASKRDLHGQTNPYKSLLDYRIEDAPHFYGRESAIKSLLDMLQDSSRLTILYADSGAGKSSLLQAGLAARLIANGRLPIIVRLRPDMPQPLDAIKEAIIPDFSRLPELKRLEKISLRGLLLEISRCLGGSPFYIFLDQFEEFFLELQLEHQMSFASQLAACLHEPGLEVAWLISLKKDHFSELSVFESTGLQPYENKFYLRQFRTDEARNVITAPGLGLNVRYEEGLVDRILQDLSQENAEIYPPEVQLVCYTLFEELRKSDKKRTITHELYDQERGEGGGGTPGILRGHLSQVLQRISRQEQELAMTILRSLVTSNHRRAVRTRSDLSNEIIQTQMAVQPAALESVIKILERNRLLRKTNNFGELEEVRYEITHDYLLKDIEIDALLTKRKKAYEMLQQGVRDRLEHGIISLSEQAMILIDEELQPSNLSAEEVEFLDRLRARYQKRIERILFSVIGGTVGGPVALFLLYLLGFLFPILREWFTFEALFGTGLIIALLGGFIGFGLSIGKGLKNHGTFLSILGGSFATALIINVVSYLLTAGTEIDQNIWIVTLISAFFGGGIAVSIQIGAGFPIKKRLLIISASGLVVGIVVVLFGIFTQSILFTWLFAFGGTGISLGIGLAELYFTRGSVSKISLAKSRSQSE